MNLVPLVLRNLARNRRRNLLTALSIAVSLFIFTALVSFPRLVEQITSDEASMRLVVANKAGLRYPLPASYRRRILALPHVKAVAGEMFFGGQFQGSRDRLAGTSIDLDQLREVYPDFRIDAATYDRLQRDRIAALAGEAIMRSHHWQIGQHVTLKGTRFPFDVPLVIVGTLGQKYQTALVFRRDYLDEMLPQKGQLSDIWVRLDQPQYSSQVSAAIDETFKDSSFETRTQTEASFVSSFLEMLGPVFALVKILAAIVLVTIGLVAANTAAMSIRERTSEAAVMRALGFGRGRIATILISESVLLGLAGGLVGSFGAYAFLQSGAFGSAIFGGLGIIRVPVLVLPEAIAVGALIGFLGAALPAARAVRREVADGLRAIV